MVNTFEPLKIEVENNSVSDPEMGSRTILIAEAEAPLPSHSLFRGPLTMHNDMEP